MAGGRNSTFAPDSTISFSIPNSGGSARPPLLDRNFAGHNLLTNHQAMITGEHLFNDKVPFDAARERSQPSLTLPAPRKRHDNRQCECGMCELLPGRVSRPLRIEFAGAVHDVMARGDRREEIFRDDRDRSKFLQRNNFLEPLNPTDRTLCLLRVGRLYTIECNERIDQLVPTAHAAAQGDRDLATGHARK